MPVDAGGSGPQGVGGEGEDVNNQTRRTDVDIKVGAHESTIIERLAEQVCSQARAELHDRITDAQIDKACRREATVEERAAVILGLLREQGRTLSYRELGENHLGVPANTLRSPGYKWNQAVDALRRDGTVVVTQGRTGGLRAV